MIFDSPEVNQLRLQYKDQPNYKVPDILLLDRQENYSGERRLLEECMSKVSEIKRREWLGRLFAKEPEQFMSAWFEMMLLHWLEPVGKVEVEPEILGNYPDFMVHTKTQDIVIEARAHLINKDTRTFDAWRSAFFAVVKQIKFPYAIEAVSAYLESFPNTVKFVDEASEWLNTNPEEIYEYRDHYGNKVFFRSHHIPSISHVELSWTANATYINPDVIKPALQEKAKSHKSIRRAGYPYIIALFIEDFQYSVDEVVTAWFGNETWIFDKNTMEVVETKRDLRGLHLYRKELSHTTVSGTLVFKERWIDEFRGRQLMGWFIENPYAKVKVDVSCFPVEDSLLVIGQSHQGYQLQWKSHKPIF